MPIVLLNASAQLVIGDLSANLPRVILIQRLIHYSHQDVPQERIQNNQKFLNSKFLNSKFLKNSGKRQTAIVRFMKYQREIMTGNVTVTMAMDPKHVT